MGPLRFASLLALAVVIAIVFAVPTGRAQALVESVDTSTDRMEYINVTGYNTVNASFVVFFTGDPAELDPVRFLWYGPGGVDLVQERYVLPVPRSATQAVADDSWTADRTGTSMSVHGSINRTRGSGDPLWSNVTFAVHDPAGWSLVTGLALQTPATTYAGARVIATVHLLWLGSGPLGSVRFVWADGNGTVVQDVSVPSGSGGTAENSWTPGREGTLRVTGTYLGADPLQASTTIAVLPASARPNAQPTLGTAFLLALAAVLGFSLGAVAFVRKRAVEGLAPAASAARRRLPAALETGGSYAVLASDPSRAYGLFASYVNAGARGLVLSRLYPDEVRARHPTGPAVVLWLSRGVGPTSVTPTNLARLVSVIEKHIAGLETSIVLLDDTEYLVTQNGAPAVAKFLERLTDAIAAHDSRLLVPMSPARLSPADLALLGRDLRPL